MFLSIWTAEILKVRIGKKVVPLNLMFDIVPIVLLHLLKLPHLPFVLGVDRLQRFAQGSVIEGVQWGDSAAGLNV